MTQSQTETPEQHKLRAIRITATARFAAAHRLRSHEKVSLFSISMCSLAVVVISLLEPFGVHLSLPSNAVNLSAAIVSLLILVVSLLVSGGKYGERAEKMHAGAVEINAVARKLEAAIAKSDSAQISSLSEQYESLLKMYENHEEIDYKVAQIKRYPEHYKIHIGHKIHCWFLCKLNLFPHLISLAISAALLFFLFWGAQLQPIP